MSITKAEAEIARLAASGVGIALVRAGAQPYALVHDVESPSPPWGVVKHDILIVIPNAFDFGTALDAFYLALPYSFNGGLHNRVSGQTIELENRQWQLASWHYPDGKAFRLGVDNIESHIIHCRGFFLDRGALNARA
jgi:hypothetical protein